MERSETQENIKLELTRAETDVICIALIMVNDILFNLPNLSETIMMLKLGVIARLYDRNTIKGLAEKFKPFLRK